MEALKGVKTNNQLSSHYEAHPIQIGIWKKRLVEHAHTIFSDEKKRKDDQQDLIDRLYKIIGQRDTELEWLKKKVHLDP